MCSVDSAVLSHTLTVSGCLCGVGVEGTNPSRGWVVISSYLVVVVVAAGAGTTGGGKAVCGASRSARLIPSSSAVERALAKAGKHSIAALASISAAYILATLAKRLAAVLIVVTMLNRLAMAVKIALNMMIILNE